ncbi:hypothetical protein V5O48_011487 [Marasmius crinis-equi]|uniref:Major facilitator superfamily (MFS) profile domain-containing protein n=1 Tax=Marasmius crinis-equi TaxID=585013 RepID=A0ABR3F5H9_9AGAR
MTGSVASTISSAYSQSDMAEKGGVRFKLILFSLFISLFVAAMELSAISTSLPTIIDSLHGTDYVWVGTAYSLASTAFLPMSGGVAEIFGRRPAMIIALGLFALGSRTVQGLGGGAIQSVSSIIISDLVSLQERGTYNAVIGMAWAFASAIGPLVGGALAGRGQWRWLFYLNLPICGVAIVAVLIFLRLPTPPGTVTSKLRKMDWIGNLLVISSTTAVVIGLSWGGVVYSWSSSHVLSTLIVGFVGFVLFFVHQAKWAANPIIPITILSNRSSVSGYIQNFINYILMLGLGYYFPVYLQACKDASSIKSGLGILPLAASIGFSAVLSGISVTITKRYRPQLWVGWVLVAVGLGLITQLGPQSTYPHLLGVSVLPGIGMGVLAAVGYFPVLAPLNVTQNAYALAFFAFGRTFAGIWGISLGNAVLQNELQKRLRPELVEALGGTITADKLYAFISQIRFLGEPTKAELQENFGDSLDVLWAVMAGVAGIGLLSSLLMKGIALQNVRDEKWTKVEVAHGSDEEKNGVQGNTRDQEGEEDARSDRVGFEEVR